MQPVNIDDCVAMLRTAQEAEQRCLVATEPPAYPLSKPVEFDGIKARIVQLLADTQKLDRIAIPDPASDNVATPGASLVPVPSGRPRPVARRRLWVAGRGAPLRPRPKRRDYRSFGLGKYSPVS